MKKEEDKSQKEIELEKMQAELEKVRLVNEQLAKDNRELVNTIADSECMMCGMTMDESTRYAKDKVNVNLRLGCSHTNFHHSCALPWLINKRTCPMGCGARCGQ